ncbi:hypothetical protein HHK36_006984 [Tetracentron sinense]|uniref:Peptidase S54 rhomboid domain-containing protein n=1 Tax=Tetracentron sinense TaxID=13715 RepID=A0A834ZK14_TETSI|nr:hypothetical protein HHK36_006984 [Tetracentron sinense]
MAVVPICNKISYKDNALSVPRVRRHNKRGITGDRISIQEGCRCFSSISSDTGRRWHALYHTTEFWMKVKTRKEADAFQGGVRNRRSMPFKTITEVSVLRRVYNTDSQVKSSSEDASQREKLCMVSYASGPSTNEKQLQVLDSYFRKLQNEEKQKKNSLMSSQNFKTASKTEEHKMQPSSEPPDKMILDRSGQFKAKTGLGSLDDYLGKLNEVIRSELNGASNIFFSIPEANSRKHVSSTFDDETTEGNPVSTSYVVNGDNEKSEERKLNSYMQLENKDDESVPESSQVPQPYDETSDLYLINVLASINIAVFLFEIASPIRNSDFEYLSLPLIYGGKINHLILVGEWWRLLTPMFLGPAFAIIGAWLIYQIQNKEEIAKEVSESMFQKVIIATALSCILSNFGPIDDWTHFGAACAGIVYGFFTCPTLQVDDGKKEGIALVRRYADPCKSLFMFTLFVVFLSSLFFFLEPQLNMLELNSFI